MKKFKFKALSLSIIILGVISLGSNALAQEGTSPKIVFNESVYVDDDYVLLSNFGSETSSPKALEKKGYILSYKNGALDLLVDGSGVLNRPTAMAIYKDKLYVTEPSALVTFDLNNLTKNPKFIKTFPQDEQYLNDLALCGSYLYVTSVQNHRVYALNLDDPKAEPKVIAKLPGPNGIVATDDSLYVVTIPDDYATITSENVVYGLKLDQKDHVEAIEILDPSAALYDGVGLSQDKKTLYYSDWLTQAVYALDLASKQKEVVYQEEGLTPADICVFKDVLYIPNLLNQEVIILDLKSGEFSKITNS